MDPTPPPPSPPQSAVNSAVNSATSKLRLMCSYGGQIIPRPRTKSLCYLGGETRIVSINPSTINTLSLFISHLSSLFTLKIPFTIKYQLPHLGLDSLISLSSDDDLQFMFCEHARLSSQSRIRLFIFFTTTRYNIIHHPKTEAWFVDALKSAKILQKGRDFLVGFDGNGVIGDNEGNGNVTLAESLVLETSSSFGSSSSSSSIPNLPPLKPLDEDVGFNSLDNATVKFTTSEPVATLASDIITTNSSSFPNSETCPGLVVRPSSVENAVMSLPVMLESNFQDPAARFHAHNMIDFSSYHLSSPSNTGMFPVSSYYQVQPQQQLLHYQPNQLYPVYIPPVGHPQLVYFPPVGQTQLAATPFNNLPIMQWGSSSSSSSSHLSVPHNASLVLPQVSDKEAASEPRSQNLGASSVINPTAFKPCDEIQQPREVGCNHNEFNDDPARIHIYKSQPPPPMVPSQFQNKTKASTSQLTEPMAQLQMIQIKH